MLRQLQCRMCLKTMALMMFIYNQYGKPTNLCLRCSVFAQPQKMAPTNLRRRQYTKVSIGTMMACESSIYSLNLLKVVS